MWHVIACESDTFYARTIDFNTIINCIKIFVFDCLFLLLLLFSFNYLKIKKNKNEFEQSEKPMMEHKDKHM